MSFGYNEDLLQFIWEYQLYDSKQLTISTGEEVTILKQGFLNKNSGPDFSNAQLKIGETTLYGAIEIHVNANEWTQHNHHTDKAYNAVILHVCYTHNSDAVREDGTSIPTVALGDRILQKSLTQYEQLMENKPFIPCENAIRLVSDFNVKLWVNRMAVERLEVRCKLFQTYLESCAGDWNQAFFWAIVRAFGMPTNTEAFAELAEKLPFYLIQKHHESLFQLEALVFGTAGLLADHGQDNYYTGLQNEYNFLSKKYGLATISSQMKMGRMRPMNLPHVKLAQLAAFFHHAPLFIAQVLTLPSPSEVKGMLTFELSGYWLSHYSFKRESKKRSKSISAGFVNHLFLNALVPFVFFYEKNKGDGATDHALKYLENIPTEKNSIITRWRNIEMDSDNALESQGLLRLYKTYCQNQRCLECNIGKKILLR
jgi:hypothetical protein